MVAESAAAHENLWVFVTIDRMNTTHQHPLRTKRERTALIASWIAVAIMAAVIFAMSAKSGIDLDENSGILSAVKAWLAQSIASIAGHPVDVSPLGHFGEYFLLGALLANALRFHLTQNHAAALAPVLASIYGVTDELHQIFTPGRSCDPMDWLVDTCAAILGALIVRALLKRR